jgi:hypothetical protein
MELRWLEGPEAAQKLNPMIEAQGWIPLNGSENPVTTRARVAFGDSGEVVGFFVLQLFPMVGPVLIQPDGKPELFRQLMRDMLVFFSDSNARGWMVVAENEKVADLCELLKMQRVEFPVYIAKGEQG